MYFIVLSFLLCARILVRAADSNKLIIKRASASHPSFAIYTYVCASDCAHLCTDTSLDGADSKQLICRERGMLFSIGACTCDGECFSSLLHLKWCFEKSQKNLINVTRFEGVGELFLTGFSSSIFKQSCLFYKI
jgi:hypothetical protein